MATPARVSVSDLPSNAGDWSRGKRKTSRARPCSLGGGWLVRSEVRLFTAIRSVGVVWKNAETYRLTARFRHNWHMSNWTCAFCSRSGVSRSKEHLLRRWFEGRIPASDGVRIMSDQYGEGTTTSKRLLTVPKSPFDITVNEICRNCNQGWMNDLESQVGDLIVELAWARRTRLTPAEVEALRFWCAKTALVKSLQVRSIPRDVDALSSLFAEQRAPSWFGVQIATCKGEAPNPVGRHTFVVGVANEADLDDSDPNWSRCQTLFTIGIGRLSVQVGYGGQDPEARSTALKVMKVVRKVNAGKWLVLPDARPKRSRALRTTLVSRDEAYMAGSIQRVVLGDGHVDGGWDDGEWSWTKQVMRENDA